MVVQVMVPLDMGFAEDFLQAYSTVERAILADHVRVPLHIGDFDKESLSIQRDGAHVFPQKYSTKILIISHKEVRETTIKYNQMLDSYKVGSDLWADYSRRENLKARDTVTFYSVPNVAGKEHAYWVTVERAVPAGVTVRILEIAEDVKYLEKKIQESEGWIGGLWGHAFYSQSEALEKKEHKVTELKQRLLALR